MTQIFPNSPYTVDSLPRSATLPREEWESHEPPLETDRHRDQIALLLDCLRWWWRERADFYASGNLTLYFSPSQRKNQDFRGPDFFVVLGVAKRDRKSWMVWEEGNLYPNVIIELLSESTAQVDRETKKELYQNQFKTPEYFWFDPDPEHDPQEWEGFRLREGVYQPILKTEQGWMWSEQLQLYVGNHEGQLRFFTPEGELVPTQAEAATQRADRAEQRAEQERQRAEQERREKERLRQRLIDLGLDPDQL